MPRARLALLCLLAALALELGAGAPDSQAFRLLRDRSFPGPVVTYHPGAFGKEARRVVRAVNRAHLGVKLKRARSKRSADIRIRSLPSGCGYGDTSVIPKLGTDQAKGLRNQALVRIPSRCNAGTRMLTVVHELGHALGLDHTNRRGCVAVTAHPISQACKLRIIRSRQPFRRDDLAGIRRYWRNTKPRAEIGVLSQGITPGTPAAFEDDSGDRQLNIMRSRWDFGDPGSSGNVQRLTYPRGYLSWPPSFPGQQVEHTFTHAGTFTVTLSVVDTYGRRSSTTQTVLVEASQIDPNY